MQVNYTLALDELNTAVDLIKKRMKDFMNIILKFGGTSVGSIEKIKKVADIVKKRQEEGNEIIVIVSAMSGVTDELSKKSNLISKNFDSKEIIQETLLRFEKNKVLH